MKVPVVDKKPHIRSCLIRPVHLLPARHKGFYYYTRLLKNCKEKYTI